MQEMFDVVDQDDKVVGRVSRERAHREGIWHRAVYVFVLNSKGELFITRRTKDKDTDPGLITCSVSGHLSSGQSYAEAAARETREEIGVDIVPMERFRMKYEPSMHHLVIYSARHDGPFRLDPEEVEKGKFIPVSELLVDVKRMSEQFAPEFRAVIRKSVDKGLLHGLPED